MSLPLSGMLIASLSPVSEVLAEVSAVPASAIPSAGLSASQAPDPVQSAYTAPAPGVH